MARLVTAAVATGRVALRQAGRSRWLRAGFSAALVTLRSIVHVLHALFLQITGVFFSLFALIFASRLPRTYHDHLAGQYGLGRVGLLGTLVVLFAWFGASSFWRAARTTGEPANGRTGGRK